MAANIANHVHEEGEVNPKMDPYKEAMEEISAYLPKIWKKIHEFDQKPNLREMLRYVGVLIGEVYDEEHKTMRRPPESEFKVKEDRIGHLKRCIRNFGTKNVVLGRVAQGGALFDVGQDLYGVYSLVRERSLSGLVLSVFLLLMNLVVQNIRGVFVGKEGYNLKRLFATGRKFNPEDETPYKHQWAVDLWNREKLFPNWKDVWGSIKWSSEDEDKSSVPPIKWFPFVLAPSFQLTRLCIREGQALKSLLRRMDSLDKEGVMDLIERATFFHFITFECDEMKKTELMLETIPQLLLKMRLLIPLVLENGLRFSSLGGWQFTTLIVSLIFLGFTMVTGTLGKLGYYFAVYWAGKDMGAYTAPDYGIPNLLLSITAHALTLCGFLGLAALFSVSERFGFLLIFIFSALMTAINWEGSDIPFHAIYTTWTSVLSSFAYKTKKLQIRSLLVKNVNLMGMYTLLLLLGAALISLDSGKDPENLRNLCIFFWLCFTTGSALQILDRYFWEKAWGTELFRSYTCGNERKTPV